MTCSTSSGPLPAIAVHGGAGDPAGGRIDGEDRYHDALADAVRAARHALEEGGSALDAAEEAVRFLEDCPLFNAGRGSVLNAAGHAELDASVMEGTHRRAGAVAAVHGVRHPVSLARAVMERTPHVLLVGAGAEAVAGDVGAERVDPEWLVTDRERARWRAGERDTGLERPAAEGPPTRGREPQPSGPDRHAPSGGAGYGTVGAVVADARGHLAAATSTGGRRGQVAGRVGDSPIVGAGTYADDEACAVSATGAGEEIIRAVAAHEVAARVRAGMALGAACESVLAERIAPLGGRAGLIAAGPRGELALAFDTALMHRASLSGEGPIRSAVWPGGERRHPV